MPGALGRLIEHDDRSRLYPFKAERRTLVSVQHLSNIGILDQDDIGACTFFATEGAVGCDPFFDTLPTGTTLDFDTGVKGYSRATVIDEFPGWYDIIKRYEDTGSSGLAAAKVAHEWGWISGYRHAFTLADALGALQTRPVITGFNWYSSFDTPGPDGLVRIASNAFPRGGHEVCADGYDANLGWVWFRNSWGPGWGFRGRFAMTADTWGRLLAERGDATVFEPLTVPPPRPIVDPADAALMGSMEPWAATIVSRITKAGKARTAYQNWKAARGYDA
jgi:hypothetical protein